jgi:ferric-dicitrate binding protein FerR (iron transport regulator)
MYVGRVARSVSTAEVERQTPEPMSNQPRDDQNPLDRAAGWIARLRAEDFGATDLREFSAWLSTNDANRAAFDRMLELWRDLGVLGEMRLGRPGNTNIRR